MGKQDEGHTRAVVFNPEFPVVLVLFSRAILQRWMLLCDENPERLHSWLTLQGRVSGVTVQLFPDAT